MAFDIQAFVSLENNLPDLGSLRYLIHISLIPQKQVVEFSGMSVSFNFNVSGNRSSGAWDQWL